MAPLIKGVSVGFVLLGLALLAFNLAGVVAPMRSPIVGTDELADDPVTVPPEEFARVIRRRGGESERDWVERATGLVDDAIGNWWSDNPADPHLRVPIRENWVLWAAGLVRPDTFGRWEFVDPRRAVRRGIGLCSQASIVLTAILRDGGVDARIAGLSGHVVVVVRLQSGDELVADPDFGLVLPHAFDTLSRDRDLVSQLYRINTTDARASGAVDAWNLEGNIIVGDVRDYLPGVYRATKTAYAMKWALPVLLVFVGALGLARTPGRVDAIGRGRP